MSVTHRRKKKKRDQGSISMNLAAMLDMAFQLLTFFILTFKPAPVEGQLSLNLPPPIPVNDPQQNDMKMGAGTMESPAMDTLHLHVNANDRGDVNEVKVESTVIVQGRFDESNNQRLDKSLQSKFSGAHVPYDRIQIAVDGRLRYGELMRIIDVCHRQKLSDGSAMQKISFTEVEVGGSPGAK